MIQSTDPADQEAATLADQPIAPHPPLHQYYEEMQARQGFLNELFNRTAYQYRNIDRATGLGSGLWYRNKALQQSGLRQGMRVLDVGCGPGLVTQCALDLVGPSGLVIGLDPSSGMLHEAQKGPCRNFVRGVGEHLPFPDQSFDFLSMGYALRHVADLRRAFTEYHRVLKPGGIVLLLEISRPRSAAILMLSRFYIKTVLGTVFSAATHNRDMQTLMGYWWDTTEYCVSPETITNALREVGFTDCSLKEWWSGMLRDYRAVKTGSKS
jgi:demethylmenaquinone methyltransferase / 2-methoxy-6-polyprenyl-1,4-benzoquinol methylase